MKNFQLKSKLLAAFLAVGLTFGTATQIRPAHAIIGAVTWNVPLLVIAGATLILAPSAGFTGVAFNATCTGTEPTCEWAVPLIVTGLALWGVGLVLLDSGSQNAQFMALDPATEKAAELTAEESIAYETEREELNAIAQEVAQQLSKDSKANAGVAKQLWESYRGAVSDEALSAAAKVARHGLKQLQAAR